jgi:FXSXX-COOH protein
MDEEDMAGPLAELPDLSGLTLVQVRRLGDSVLDNCLRRVVAEADSGTEVIAGFEAVMDADPTTGTGS